jgi:hypothetical protein
MISNPSELVDGWPAPKNHRVITEFSRLLPGTVPRKSERRFAANMASNEGKVGVGIAVVLLAEQTLYPSIVPHVRITSGLSAVARLGGMENY